MKKPTAAELLRQREAVVEFGRGALESDSLDKILHDACRLTARAMGTEFSKVMHLIDEGSKLLVIAGVGWRDGIVGHETVPAALTSSEGFAVTTGFPAVSEDIDDEERFDYAGFLKQHGVKSMVNVIIPGAQGDPPYGLLQVDSTERREFTKEDIQFLQGYANVLGAAIARHRFQRELAEALEERQRLYAELQHRINNTLMMITSLLRMRSERTKHPAIKQEIDVIQSQVDILTDVYRKLHASGAADEVELGGYLASLCSSVLGLTGDRKVAFKNRSDHVTVEPKLAVPLGLVANEFVTNSVKHSPPGAKLTVSLDVARTKEKLSITLADNGPGIGERGSNNGNKEGGVGLGLIDSLLDQLGVESRWASDKGTKLSIHVPVALHVIGPVAD